MLPVATKTMYYGNFPYIPVYFMNFELYVNREVHNYNTWHNFLNCRNVTRIYASVSVEIIKVLFKSRHKITFTSRFNCVPSIQLRTTFITIRNITLLWVTANKSIFFCRIRKIIIAKSIIFFFKRLNIFQVEKSRWSKTERTCIDFWQSNSHFRYTLWPKYNGRTRKCTFEVFRCGHYFRFLVWAPSDHHSIFIVHLQYYLQKRRLALLDKCISSVSLLKFWEPQ